MTKQISSPPSCTSAPVRTRLALMIAPIGACIALVAAPILGDATAIVRPPKAHAAERSEPGDSDSHEPKQPAAERSLESRLADLHLWERAWESDVVYAESSILLKADQSTAALARLAYPAEEILQVKTASGTEMFEPGRDYVLTEDRLHLRFDKVVAVEPIAESDLFRAPDSPQSYRHRAGHPEQSLLYAPGRWFHDRNIEITYRRQRAVVEAPDREVRNDNVASRSVASPVVANYGSITKTQQLLRDKSPFRVVLVGDSISTGLDASGLSATAPNQPGYPDLVIAQLQETFGSRITLQNVAVSGTSIASGISAIDALRTDQRSLTTPPQLLVVAYGMNDVGRRDPAWFGDQAKQILHHAVTVWPDIDVLFVSPMLGNPEWVHTPPEMFPKYALELRKLASDRVALADVTAVWTDMTHNKHPLDITGNGLNHPNDCGHRLYAQTLLSCFPRTPSKSLPQGDRP